MIGTTLGHYAIIQKLGSGGMGEVYVADDTKLGRRVALKVLPPQIAGSPEFYRRFEREARAVASLNHPNIVTLYSFEEQAGTHFITMELVRGKTLSELIPKQGLPLARFFEMALPLAEALSAAHAQGITHRDLKPDNVVVSADGQPKILDFGLAKLQQKVLGGDSATDLLTKSVTQEGQILGTIAYMSPEQAEGKPVDARSDIFSLGVIFYEMLTGRRPFRGDSLASVISSILRDDAASITELNRALPRELDRIIRRCLAKDPQRRHQTALDVRNELEGLRSELGAAGPTALISRRTGRWVAAAVAVAAVGLLGFAYLLGRGTTRRSAPPTAPLEGTAIQLTHEPGQELFPSLPPDGKSIVYADRSSGNWDIFLRRVGGENVVNLTRDSAADDTQPAFSPVGDRIAFRSDREGGGIFVMESTGESVKRVSDFGYNPAWCAGGQKIVFATESVVAPESRPTTSQLWAADLASGEKELLTKGDGLQPHCSPHGHRVAYWGRVKGSGKGSVWTMPAGGGEPVRVTRDDAVEWNPVWSPDGRHLYFSSDRSGSMNLWRVRIAEDSGEVLGPPEPVTTGVAAASEHISISQDGRRIAYVVEGRTGNLQKIAFDPSHGRTAGAPVPVTRGSRLVGSPDLSPDGQWLAFTSSGKQEDLYVIRADGTGLRQLTDDAAADRSPRWSPDGTRIAFVSDRTGKYEIWAVQPDGSGLRQLTRSPGAHDPVWLSDGTGLVYATHNPNGTFLFDPRKPWSEQRPVTLPSLPDPNQTFEAWSCSPRGRTLAGQRHLADGAHSGIGLLSLESGQYDWVADFGSWPLWLSDARRLLFSSQGKIFLVDSTTRKPHEILTAADEDIGSFTVSRDDRSIYFTFVTREADIWLLALK